MKDVKAFPRMISLWLSLSLFRAFLLLLLPFEMPHFCSALPFQGPVSLHADVAQAET